MKLPSPRALLKLGWRHPQYFEHLLTQKLKLLARYRWIEENQTQDGQVPPPLIYKLVLTYKCNLRCTFCYEWGSSGWCTGEPSSDHVRKELPWSVVEKLFAQSSNRPAFILSGGEPMIYSRFRDLALMFKQNRCVAITCTNGMLLNKHLDVSAGNPYLTYLISLDGLESENDRLRGDGVYKRVTANIRALKSIDRPPYVGVQFTLRPDNVSTMYDFCRRMEDLNVDWVLLNLCWFVSDKQASDYEEFMQQHFGIRATSQNGFRMPYDLDKQEFERQYQRITDASWRIQISCYLKDPKEIHTFVDTPDIPPRNTFCYKQWLRMDITPEGTVAPCILYPDLITGDLTKNEVSTVWNSPEYAQFRSLRREHVLPICSKCHALYLYDAKRKIL